MGDISGHTGGAIPQGVVSSKPAPASLSPALNGWEQAERCCLRCCGPGMVGSVPCAMTVPDNMTDDRMKNRHTGTGHIEIACRQCIWTVRRTGTGVRIAMVLQYRIVMARRLKRRPIHHIPLRRHGPLSLS